ncbi:MAG: hypothetical protein PWQ56_73 [Patescibacteria group bacterium]|nr:hypothetical protein [Patescibacteria group bacterium]
MIDDILQFLESSELFEFLFPFKVLFIIISIAFIFAIFYYFIKVDFLTAGAKRRINDFLSFQKFDSKNILTKRAKKISSFLNKRDYKKAILMMEELLIEALKNKGTVGVNLYEMIENSSIADIEGIKDIYTIAEEIKEGQGYILNMEELQKLFDSCEEALKRLEVLT